MTVMKKLQQMDVWQLRKWVRRHTRRFNGAANHKLKWDAQHASGGPGMIEANPFRALADRLAGLVVAGTAEWARRTKGGVNVSAQ